MGINKSIFYVLVLMLLQSSIEIYKHTAMTPRIIMKNMLIMYSIFHYTGNQFFI